jgi:hypothetical protein
VTAPRGAALAAQLMVRMVTWLEAVTAARAAAASRRQEATRIREAAETRRFAQQWVERDPRFASDLMAAADRHELNG